MKRILSILMSVALVTTLLISMSVNSFAVTYTPEPDNWNALPENGTVVTTVTEVTGTEADEACAEFIGVDWAELSSYYEGDVYLFKIKVDITNMVPYTVKSGIKYYGKWLTGYCINLEFDPTVLAYSEDVGDYFALKWGDDSGEGKFSTNPEASGGRFLIGRAENYSQKTLKELAPMNGTNAEHSAGDGAADYTFELIVMTSTNTFDFNIANLYYTTFEIPAENANATTKAPTELSTIGTSVKYTLPYELLSVVDGELAVDEPEPETHAFVVYGEGDVELANETLEEGEVITMPTAPAVEGKTFSHWATTKGGSEVEPATTMGTEDLTYYAVYTVNKYTITFVVDGNTTTKEVEHGTIPTYDGTPSKDGYTFTGWDKEFVAATENTTYTAQFVQNAPTQYEITFVVDGDETIVMTNAGDTPVFPGTPAKDGYNFTGWSPALVPATGAATYTAQFELIPVEPEGDAVTMDEPVYIDGSNGDILPGGVETVKVNPFGTEHTVKAAELLRVHTDFTYDSSKGTLKEMGMLFVPKAVAGSMNKDEIIAAEIAKDACCTNIPYLTGGGNVTFKAGLVDIPYKNIEIYAIPYYKLSGGERIYQAMQTILFD